jgi:hypothetical protein
MLVFTLLVIALVMIIVAVNSKVERRTFSSVECEFVATSGPGLDEGAQVPTNCREVPRTANEDDRIRFREDLRDTIGGSGIAFMLLAVLFGTTFIGADLASGAIGGQLTFEPRRVYFFTMKTLAVTVAVTIITIALLVVLIAALALVAATRGVVGSLDGSWWTERAADVLRVALTCGGLAAVALGITTIARRTVAAVVGFLALAFIVEPAANTAIAWIDGFTPVFAFLSVAVNDFTDNDAIPDSLESAIAVSLAWAALVLVAAGIIFARREIR